MTKNPPTVREACRRRMPIDVAEAQVLEHALTITERELATARRELAALEWLNSESGYLAKREGERVRLWSSTHGPGGVLFASYVGAAMTVGWDGTVPGE